MKEKLKNLKMEMKLKQAFKLILSVLIGAIAIAVISIVMINMNLNRFYQEASVSELSQAAVTAHGRASDLVMISFGVLVIAGVAGVILCKKVANVITELFVEPIKELENAAQQLKEGELDIEIAYVSQDEMGGLADNFREACTQMHTVIEDAGYLLSKMAEGNFSVETNMASNYVGDFSLLLESMRKLNNQMNDTLKQISVSAGQVMVGSGQLADSAQSLAEGATEQAGAVEELTATIESVTNIAEESANGAVMAASTAKASVENAQKSREEINGLIGAMERITETSKEIENIIATIEDIASQTNLLSLNASIEAARAGEAGRGFAVVADQIGKLASDSAESAISTKELINKSLIEVENGNRIVAHTMDIISSVLESMEQFAEMASGAAESSKTQADMLKQIEAGVEQISSVVVNNSTYAEENSAISQELFAQAQSLEQMVSAFELRNE